MWISESSVHHPNSLESWVLAIRTYFASCVAALQDEEWEALRKLITAHNKENEEEEKIVRTKLGHCNTHTEVKRQGGVLGMWWKSDSYNAHKHIITEHSNIAGAKKLTKQTTGGVYWRLLYVLKDMSHILQTAEYKDVL